MKSKKNISVFFAVLAAVLYAINLPFSKILLNEIPVTMMAAFLYLGAGIGLSIVGFVQKGFIKSKSELPLTKKELPFTVMMVVLDIAAPIFLMVGLSKTTAANASLLNNFEIAATSLIAFFLFREAISRRLWIAVILVTIASVILSFEDVSSFSFSVGSIFVLLACICWGFENNCTRKISNKSPLQIVVIKGFGSGLGSLAIALAIGEKFPQAKFIFAAILLGFAAYGLSIMFYIYAQRNLGAAKTSTYYAITPFIGVVISLIIFGEIPSAKFFIALLIMIIGTYFASKDISK